MGVLSDRQIEKEVKITPFQKDQVRQGVISSGLSSFGYDVRAGYKFQIFTDVNCSVIDPKAFDKRMLVDVDLTPGHDWKPNPEEEVGSICSKCGLRIAYSIKAFPDAWAHNTACHKTPNHVLIPPNSFALAETLEHLEIPRDTLAIVLGKSTYARCFSGDTRVLLASGKTPTFRQMANNPSKRRWGFGVNPKTGEYQMTELVQPRLIGRESLVRVTLDNGAEIDCTPDHKFLRHGGFYTEAQDLCPGDGIVPLYEKRFRGRRMIYIPRLRNWLPAHWLADNWNVRHGIYSDVPGTHRHHKNGDKTDDDPTNIERKSVSAHVRYHNTVYYGEGFDADMHALLIRNALAKRMKDPEWAKAVSRMNSGKAKRFWADPANRGKQRKVIEALRAAWTPEREKAHVQRMVAYNATVTSEERSRRWSPERRAKQAEVMRRVRAAYYGGNHTVVSVKTVKGQQDVYCVTSMDTGNFALASGVIAQNCGLIVNCTPLEPEWRGKVTMELSNTTPLPIKVYAGEGIAQVYFLRSDECREGVHVSVKRMLEQVTEVAGSFPVPRHFAYAFDLIRESERSSGCQVSYADRKGRYQDQAGLTHPFVDKGGRTE